MKADRFLQLQTGVTQQLYGHFTI